MSSLPTGAMDTPKKRQGSYQDGSHQAPDQGWNPNEKSEGGSTRSIFPQCGQTPKHAFGVQRGQQNSQKASKARQHHPFPKHQGA